MDVHVKCANLILDLLNNAGSNAEIKGLDRCLLAGRISHPSQAKVPDLPSSWKNQPYVFMSPDFCNFMHAVMEFFLLLLFLLVTLAAYMSSPCHIELILSEKEEPETQFKKSSGGSSGNDIDSDKYKMLTASTLGYV